MAVSETIWGLSVPPAIEKPKPDVPRSNEMSSYCQLSSPFTYICQKQQQHISQTMFVWRGSLEAILFCSHKLRLQYFRSYKLHRQKKNENNNQKNTIGYNEMLKINLFSLNWACFSLNINLIAINGYNLLYLASVWNQMSEIQIIAKETCKPLLTKLHIRLN